MTPSPILLPEEKRQEMADWYRQLQREICHCFETIEQDYSALHPGSRPGEFERRRWERNGGGGGEMAVLRGQVFEKVGVNVSTVFGPLAEAMREQLPGTEAGSGFWASGISVVAHMQSPLVPAIHMNTRTISTAGHYWFGGGMDLTPSIQNDHDTAVFHASLEACCNRHDPADYARFKAECDRYFFLPHRNEPRGIGGIFYDQLQTDWAKDVSFTKEVGTTFLSLFQQLVTRHMHRPWTEAEKEIQRIKRGRYVEFNLLYDRGTKFGFMTGGDSEAILMSLPPSVSWP